MTPIEEMAWKLSRLAMFLDRHRLDAVLLTLRPNFSWLTCGCTNHVAQGSERGTATLLVTKDKVVCVGDSIEAPRMRSEELREQRIEVVEFPWYDAAASAKVWAQTIGERKVATDYMLPNLPDSVVQMPQDFAGLRWQLCQAERRRYRGLGVDVGAALQRVCRDMQPGQSEFEVAAALTSRLNRQGVRTPVVLVAGDERIEAYRHPIPTDRKIQQRAMVVVCGERHGLVCSATRIVSFGAPSADLRRKHDAVVHVDAAFINETKPGNRLGHIFAAAQKTYADMGYADQWKLHHQGGATGYLAREVKATPGSEIEVLADQAFAWNPSITGTKSEDTILVRAHGPEILTQAVDWPMIDVTMGDATIRRPDILVRS